MTLLLFSACTPQHRQQVDELNRKAYVCHYLNLDSVQYLSSRALSLSSDYDQGQAEALNNLAFVCIMRMQYAEAYKLLHKALTVTDNQFELLISDVQLMRLCQRQSRNKEFYDYRQEAIMRLRRIDESTEQLSVQQRNRIAYARSEMNIVSAAYFYYVGQMDDFRDALSAIDPEKIENDIPQLLNYYYNIGAGGYIKGATQTDVAQKEFDSLLKCYFLATNSGYQYWRAQSLEAISLLLQDSVQRNALIETNLPAIKYLNDDQMPYDLLAGNMSQRALGIFQTYGDVYQTAGANRTLASHFFSVRDYRSALICLQRALDENPAVLDAPDLVASIREQMCMSYSALDDKPASDRQRNLFLDIQEQTRQDRFLESRASQLSRSSMQLNALIVVIAILIVLFIFLLFLYYRKSKRRNDSHSVASLLAPLQQWKQVNGTNIQHMEEKSEEIKEKLAMSRMHISDNKRRYLEQSAKVSFVESITPLIDRMVSEIHRLASDTDEYVKEQRYEYINELICQINQYNDILTRWIQMRQGKLNLHIESFPIQQLLDVVSHGSMSYNMKHITLHVEPSKAIVKADRTLTLFMINTIADNARKFTEPGGLVEVTVSETDEYVEISVSDNGKGMDEETLSHLFERTYTGGHGFGLLNCKGIIEQYKKISSIFNVCDISCESKLGVGTTIRFRLPCGGKKHPKHASLQPKVAKFSLMALLAAGLLSLIPVSAKGQLADASYYAERTYECNVSGSYDSTMLYSDSALYSVKHSTISSEQDSIECNNILLSVYNETAVAALALHKWDVYTHYNSLFTALFNQVSADNTLGDYVRKMQQSETNKNVAVVILIILLVLIVPVYYFMYYRHQLYYRYCIDCVNNINKVLLGDEEDEAKLKKITRLWDDTISKGGASASQALVGQLTFVVEQIKNTLEKSIDFYRLRSDDMDLAADELERSRFECDRLHVCNAVLDNCLSTLKHETMYYPSRIKQLMNQKDDAATEKQLHDEYQQQLSQIVDYYRELYVMLSSQASKQLACLKLHFTREAFDYMLQLLAKTAGCKNVEFSVSVSSEQYAKVSVPLPGLVLTDEQMEHLFTPLTTHVDMLLVRQMIREVGEETNMRASGTRAVRGTDGNVTVEIILPKKICKTLKLL